MPENEKGRGGNTMVYFYIGTMFLVVYSGVLWATYLKFSYNGIKLNVKYKAYLSVLPIFILYMHIRLAARFFKDDKKKSILVLLFAFTKYPILIGNLIEILLENMAECYVFGNSRLLKIKKTEKVDTEKESNIKDTILGIKEIFSYFKRGSVYERELLSTISV